MEHYVAIHSVIVNSTHSLKNITLYISNITLYTSLHFNKLLILYHSYFLTEKIMSIGKVKRDKWKYVHDYLIIQFTIYICVPNSVIQIHTYICVVT